MQAEVPYAALRVGAGAETGGGVSTSPLRHPGRALGEGSTAAALKRQHRPAQKLESACDAGRRAVQEAQLR